MNSLKCIAKRFLFVLIAVFCFLWHIQPFVMKAHAKSTSLSISGNIYEFASNAHYEFSTAIASGSNAFGTFSITGDLKDSDTKNGKQAYTVSSGNVDFYYSYKQSKLNVAETEWHLIDDKTKKVDTISIDQNILSGTIIVQSSRDGMNWMVDEVKTNVFSADTDLSDSLYTTKEIQLQNGCYYRVIVAYELQRKVGERKTLFGSKDNTEEKKFAEVYEFYAISSDIAEDTISAATIPRKELGQKINTGLNNGFSGNIAIDKKDPHFGWDLGTFVVNGYTRDTGDTSDNKPPVFLKNVGDKVSLWFTLAQDINNLNGNSALTISEDNDGYDQYFEISQTNFKHGTLIIRYTDHEGNTHTPVIYTDFLAANAATGADTRVQLFEEGDYEVSLDYEIKNSAWFSPATNYKIFFKFSIRNGNCMVYPFDTTTGAELSDWAITPNGFKLDMAKSRYLTIDVTRTVLNEGTDGQLTEDVRFNRPAKDNEEYLDDGIYTFSVKNLYTGETTSKTIYVGSDKYLKALSKNNEMNVDDLNIKIEQLATINDDGTITEYVPPEEPEPAETEPEEPEQGELEESEPDEPKQLPVIATVPTVDDTPSENLPAEEESEPATDEAPPSNVALLICIIVLLGIAVVVAVVIVLKRNKQKKAGTDL